MYSRPLSGGIGYNLFPSHHFRRPVNSRVAASQETSSSGEDESLFLASSVRTDRQAGLKAEPVSLEGVRNLRNVDGCNTSSASSAPFLYRCAALDSISVASSQVQNTMHLILSFMYRIHFAQRFTDSSVLSVSEQIQYSTCTRFATRLTKTGCS